MDKAAQVLSMLVEGMSVEATSRLTDTHKHTILDLLALVGYRCQQFLTRTIRRLNVSDVQCDEIWQFVYCKNKQAPRVIADGTLATVATRGHSPQSSGPASCFWRGTSDGARSRTR